MSHLLHAELFEGVPLTGSRTADNLNTRAEEIASTNVIYGGITIAIRARNEADQLQNLLEDISFQELAGDVETLIVDNDSTDHTRAIAHEYGAQIVRLPRDEFTYPKSMNIGMEAASFDNVFLTVGHALLSNDQTLRAGMHQMNKPDMAGAFSVALPSSNASRTERYLAMGNVMFSKNEEQVKKAGLGVLAATGAFVSRPAWEELGMFDERYQSGGEDTALAEKILDSGMQLVKEPLLAVHHTHGLGFRDTVKQWSHWMKTVNEPQQFDRQALLDRRPDLNAKYEDL